jgi:multidrug resistance protein MdtO
LSISLPHFTDIGQLCALTAVVALFAGWVTTRSERLSYAGIQIALAFLMGLLQTYSPANDLTVLRDRVVGILLGNVVMTLGFSGLWPESAITGGGLSIGRRDLRLAHRKSEGIGTRMIRRSVASSVSLGRASQASTWKLRAVPHRHHSQKCSQLLVNSR